jgi:hypothetical protein
MDNDIRQTSNLDAPPIEATKSPRIRVTIISNRIPPAIRKDSKEIPKNFSKEEPAKKNTSSNIRQVRETNNANHLWTLRFSPWV